MKTNIFDTAQIEQYAKEAKAEWGNTPEYREYEAKKLSPEQQQDAAHGLMELFKDFAAVKDGAPDSKEAQATVKRLQAYISVNFYSCSDEVLSGLGKLYGAGGAFTENIDAYAGPGTASFAAEAIAAYCKT